MSDSGSQLELVRSDDGSWAVVQDGEELATHPSKAGAEAERTRLAQDRDPGTPEPDLGGDDEGRAPQDEPYPDNVGG